MRGIPLKEEDYVAKRYGRLVVLGFSHRGSRGTGYWKFQCDCGNTHISTLHHVTGHKTLSCGCLNRALSERRTANSTHRLSETPEYNVWQAMLNRCRNKNLPSYKNYGGRGIFVCERWRSFENFYQDMGARPYPEASLERIDNDGPYSPDNVKWLPKSDQGKNRRNSVLVTVDGRPVCLADAARHYGIAYAAVHARLRLGWTVQKALKSPIRKGKTK